MPFVYISGLVFSFVSRFEEVPTSSFVLLKHQLPILRPEMAEGDSVVAGDEVLLYQGKTHVGEGQVIGSDGSLKRSLHGHALGDGLVVVTGVYINNEQRELPYRYEFKSFDDVPNVLGDMLPSGTYAWALKCIRKKNVLGAAKKRTLPAPLNSEKKRLRGENGGSTEDVQMTSTATAEGCNSRSTVQTDSGVTKELNFADYAKVSVTVDIDDTKVLPNKLRMTDKSWANQYISELKAGGYGSVGHIVVCALKLHASEEANLRKRKDGDVLRYTPWIIDGHHRRLALLDSEVPASIKKSVSVKLWYRKDGRSLSETEMLRIGSSLNNAASKVKPTSLLDKIYSCVSYAKTVCATNGANCGEERFVNLDVGKLSKLMTRDCLIGKMTVKQYRKYAQVAWAVSQNEELYESLSDLLGKQENQSIGISHISNAKIWNRSDQAETTLLLHSVVAYVSSNAKKGYWALTESSFLDTAISILGAFNTMCKEANIDVRSALKLSVQREKLRLSIAEMFSDTVAKFKFERDSQEMRSQVSNLKSSFTGFVTKNFSSFKIPTPRYQTRAKVSGHASQRTKPWRQNEKSVVNSGTRGRTKSATDRPKNERVSKGGKTLLKPPSMEIPQLISEVLNAGAPVSENGSSSGSSCSGSDINSETIVDKECALAPDSSTPVNGICPVQVRQSVEPSEARNSIAIAETLKNVQQKSASENTGNHKGMNYDSSDSSSDESGPESSSESASCSNSESLSRSSPAAGQGPQEPKRGNALDARDSNDILSGVESPAQEFRPESTAAISRPKSGEMTAVENAGKKYVTSKSYFLKELPFQTVNSKLYDGGKPHKYFEDLVALFPDPQCIEGGEARVEHASPWLSALGAREPHRSHYVLDANDVEDIQTAVLQHAVLSSIDDEKRAKSDFSRVSLKVAHTLQASDQKSMSAAGRFLNGFCKDSDLPKEWVKVWKHPPSTSEDCIETLIPFFEERFPGEERFANPAEAKHLKSWAPTVNKGKVIDAKIWDSGTLNARYATTKYGVTTDIENDRSSYHIVRKRAQLDVRLLQIAAFLRLRFEAFDGSKDHGSESPDTPNLYAADTGGAFLLTSRECDRQIVHCDFEWARNGIHGDAPKNPSYSFLVSGGNPTPIWISDHSHKFVYYTVAQKRDLASVLQLRKRIIPAHSVLVIRGDVAHAGAGHQDTDTQYNTRYLLYLIRNGVTHKGSLTVQIGFNPSFQADDY